MHFTVRSLYWAGEYEEVCYADLFKDCADVMTRREEMIMKTWPWNIVKITFNVFKFQFL